MSVLTQTLAIFIDAYRELNAKKLFWITLVLSLLLVVALALFGVSPTGVKFLHWEFPIPTPELYYKAVLLKYFVVDLWLTWAASVLALISTGGIFPDFLSGGAIDLYLCKPMSRPRLFLTKYVSGLMFVGLQVSFVSVGIFFVVGFRISDWRPSIFLAIPLVLCFFSYIYSVCVLLGVMTRSTVAAILLTVLVWIVFFSIRFFEPQILQFQYANEARIARYDDRIKRGEAQLSRLHDHAPTTEQAIAAEQHTSDLAKWRLLRDGSAHAARTCKFWHDAVYIALTLAPKGGPTIDLLDDYLFTKEELGTADTEETRVDYIDQGTNPDADQSVLMDQGAQMIAMHRVKQTVHSRSLLWIIGTSLGFEAIMVVCAGWLFCRRDY